MKTFYPFAHFQYTLSRERPPMDAAATVKFDPTEHQHRRYNPLTEEWLLVSPHRLKRPWSGQVEKAQEEVVPPYDPKNPLCPRATRANGKVAKQLTSCIWYSMGM